MRKSSDKQDFIEEYLVHVTEYIKEWRNTWIEPYGCITGVISIRNKELDRYFFLQLDENITPVALRVELNGLVDRIIQTVEKHDIMKRN
jgi:hypothetical protein